MFEINPILACDSYKLQHILLNAQGTETVYCNLTARSFKYITDVFPKGFFNQKVVIYGLQSSLKEIVDTFNSHFFNMPIENLMKEFKETILPFVGDNDADLIVEKFVELHKLGYLPLEFKSLPEGTQVSSGIPLMTWKNTDKRFFWLPNYLETYISCMTWKLCTVATISKVYRNIGESFATKTGVSLDFIDFQFHDFSNRGQTNIQDASRSGSAHLTSFKGTDSISSIGYINKYYNKNKETLYIGGSVKAYEHSLCCNNIAQYAKVVSKEHPEMNKEEVLRESECLFIKDMLKNNPTGIVSYVSDSYDYFYVLVEITKRLKQEIMARQKDSNGFCKLVLRPDSGCPEDIICGTLKDIQDYSNKSFDVAQDYAKEDLVDKIGSETPHGEMGEYEVSSIFKYKGKYFEIKVEIEWNRYDKQYYYIDGSKLKSCEEITLTPEQKGSVECLDEIFGHTLTPNGYKVLDEHIGLIYGDSITPQRAYEILDRLEKKGYASSNIVLGVGSATYQGLI